MVSTCFAEVVLPEFRKLAPGWYRIAGADVAGMTLEEAGERLTELYSRPVYIDGRGEKLNSDPPDVNFQST